MKKVLFPLAVMAMVFSGCTTYYTDRSAQSRVNPTQAGGADYFTKWKVDDARVEAESSAAVLFGLFLLDENKNFDLDDGVGATFTPSGRAVRAAKMGATYDACEQNNADNLLGAIYTYKVTNFCYIVQTVDCKVQGYPAFMNGVEFIESKPWVIEKDQEVIQLKPYETLRKPEDTSFKSMGLERPAAGTANGAVARPTIFSLLFPF